MYEELVNQLREPCQYENCILCQQAADAIEELLKAYQMMAEAYEAEVTRPRWIPVTERLPENDTAVLVTYIGYNSHKSQADLLAYRHDGKWLWVEDATSYAPLGTVECAVPITYWMPLPEPPKEEQPTMYYPQVDGITPTLITPKEEQT